MIAHAVCVCLPSLRVNLQLLYCQSPNGQPDADSSCSSICHRASNKIWDLYRSDCSGLVSYSYALGAPGRTTGQFAPFQTDVSFQLSSPDLLQPGDPINSTPHEHIMLFVKWTSGDKSSALFFEEPECGGATPYARATESAVTHNSDGTLTVHQNGMRFVPIRMNSNKNVC